MVKELREWKSFNRAYFFSEIIENINLSIIIKNFIKEPNQIE